MCRCSCPLYPQKRTLDPSREMSAKCQTQTLSHLFDHVVGAFGTCRLGLSILRLKVSAFGE